MKKFFLLTFLFFSFPVFAAEKADLVVQTFDEKNFDLKKFRGKKNVIVSFWAYWCGDCIELMAELEEIHQKCPQLEIIGISIDRKRALEKVLEKVARVSYPNALLDDATENNFPEIDSVPRMFLVNKDGDAEEIDAVPKWVCRP